MILCRPGEREQLISSLLRGERHRLGKGFATLQDCRAVPTNLSSVLCLQRPPAALCKLVWARRVKGGGVQMPTTAPPGPTIMRALPCAKPALLCVRTLRAHRTVIVCAFIRDNDFEFLSLLTWGQMASMNAMFIWTRSASDGPAGWAAAAPPPACSSAHFCGHHFLVWSVLPAVAEQPTNDKRQDCLALITSGRSETT